MVRHPTVLWPLWKVRLSESTCSMSSILHRLSSHRSRKSINQERCATCSGSTAQEVRSSSARPAAGCFHNEMHTFVVQSGINELVSHMHNFWPLTSFSTDAGSGEGNPTLTQTASRPWCYSQLTPCLVSLFLPLCRNSCTTCRKPCSPTVSYWGSSFFFFCLFHPMNILILPTRLFIQSFTVSLLILGQMGHWKISDGKVLMRRYSQSRGTQVQRLCPSYASI